MSKTFLFAEACKKKLSIRFAIKVLGPCLLNIQNILIPNACYLEKRGIQPLSNMMSKQQN